MGYTVSSWVNFGVAVAGVAGALVGLLFVAVSVRTSAVYSEPSGMNHFARTDAEPVLVQISGFGPTDTRYVNPSDAPKDQRD